MNQSWLKVFLAAFFEVGWVIGLKHSVTWWQWGATVVAITVSFYALIAASRKLPVGTVYAVFVGLGTAGTVLAESFLFGETLYGIKIALIVLLLVGVIGLKATHGEEPVNAKEAE
ncbi:multidrug resistance protein SMR [Paenibacillus swuensis]|uniref:Multidrug resistance protein SMR n=1 Tax=Paenibacillus swuensis TaxID=1178515 RepID=A0A172TN63_9BACL|nr:multidrug efflux SMR transporter [Paenibacillus swuensis]ANE48529.1 multidrug resistance protein SMR [Paenibacillus swuensis]